MNYFNSALLTLLTLSPLISHGEESNSILSDINPPQKNTISTKVTTPTVVKNFMFTDMKGKKHELNDYRGKWLIVNYWATYCSPCRVEAMDINIFSNKFKDKVSVLGMDAGGNPIDELEAFKKEFEISYPLVPAQDSTLLGFGEVEAIPTTFIVSPEGKLVDKHVGMITYDDLYFYTHPEKKQRK